MEVPGVLIRSIRDNIANELFGDLRLASAKRAAADIMLIIDRLIAEDAVLAERFAELKQGWPSLAMLAPAHARGPDLVKGDVDILAESRARLDELRQSPEHVGRFGEHASDESAWLASAIESFDIFTRDMEDAIELTVPKENGLDTDSRLEKQLSAYLRHKFPELGDDPVLQVELLDGGKSKMTASARLRDSAILPSKVILRLDHGDTSFTGAVAAEEYPLLRALHEAGIPVPRPIAAEFDPKWLGGSFLLMSEIEGAHVAGDGFPELGRRPDLSPEFGRQAARVMARFHNIKAVPGWNRSGNRASPCFSDALAAFTELWRSCDPPEAWIGVDLGLAWLQSHPLPADRPQCLVHSDMGAQNILVRDGNLDVVLDWELAHFGDPAEDLGFCRLILLDGIISWDDFVAEYLAAGGREAACDPFAVSFFGVWAWTRVSIQVAMLLKSFESGSRNDTGSARAMDAGSRLQRYLARELKAAIALHQEREGKAR